MSARRSDSGRWTSARTRKVSSDLLANRARSLLAVVSLAVGTIAVGAMFLAGNTVKSSFQATFLAANPPSASLGTDPFSIELIDEVLAHRAIDQAEGRRLLPARTSDANGAFVTVELVSMPEFADNTVARIEPLRGTWPPVAGQVVVERASLTELGVDLGDTLVFDLPGSAPVHLQVTGSAFDVYEVTPMFGGPIRAYVSMETIAELTGTTHLDALYLRAASNPLDRLSAIAATTALRDEVLAPAGVAVLWSAIQEPGEHRANNAVAFMVTVMQLMSILALLVAVALVVNTVAALLAQQRRHIGVMKTVGATSGQLTAQYLGYVLLLSAVALVVAVPISVLTGRFLAGFLADLGNFNLQPLGVPWATIGLQVLVVTVLPVIAVLVSVRRATRATVQETITDRGIAGRSATGRNATRAARPRWLGLPVLRPTSLSYRNAVRNRTRLALTVVTIALCGAVLVGVLSTGSALSRLTGEVAGYWNYDVEITLTSPVPLAEAVSVLQPSGLVAGVEGWFATEAFLIRPDGTENEGISITAAVADSPSLVPTLLEGRWFEPGDQQAIVINTHFADEEPDLGLGGQVLLDVQGHRQQWTVIGISSTTLVGPVGYLAVDELTEVIGNAGATNLLAVQLAPGADPNAAAAELDAMARAGGLPVAQVQTNAQLRSYLDDLVALIVSLLSIVGVLLAVVAVVGVAGTMTLSVVEQTREVGVMRTLGASGWAVRKMLLLQGLAIAVLGGAVGVLLSIPVAWLLAGAIGQSLISTPLPTSFSWLGVALWSMVALAIGALGATRPARVAAKLTIRDTLSYE